MNQNIAYFSSSNSLDHRQSNVLNAQNSLPFHAGSVDFHPSGGSNFHSSSNAGAFHANSGTFVTNSVQQNQNHSISQQQGQQRISSLPVAVSSGQQPGTVHVQLVPQGGSPGSAQQHIIIAQNSEPDERRMAAFMEYFVEQQPVCSQNANNNMQYQSPQGMVTTKYAIKNKINSVEKSEKDQVKRAKQAEAARQRYHRLTSDEKKALNLKRTLAQKRKRQREKELAELEQILRQTNDIVDDPEVTEQLREKRMRARWAEAARTRYQRMSSEERRVHNTKRRQRQVSVKNDKGEPVKEDDVARSRIKEQNAKKAECARLRYHRMSLEEKKMYNQRRTEAFRRRRMEEEALLAMPIGRINGEALDRAQQIVVRNAKRAEAARLRYQRMTPDQRKAYNQKRYTPKRKRDHMSAGGDCDVDSLKNVTKSEEDEFDALSSLERGSQQAQQALQRQRQSYGPGAQNAPGTVGNHLAQHQQQQTPLSLATQTHQHNLNQQQSTPQHQQIHLQQSGNSNLHSNSGQHPIQLQYTSGGMIVGQHLQQQPQLLTTYATQHPNA